MSLLSELFKHLRPPPCSVTQTNAHRVARSAARYGLAKGHDGPAFCALVGLVLGCGKSSRVALSAYTRVSGSMEASWSPADLESACEALRRTAPVLKAPPACDGIFGKLYVVLVPRGGLGSAQARALLEVVETHGGTGAVWPKLAVRGLGRELAVVASCAKAARKLMSVNSCVRLPEWIPRSVAMGRLIVSACFAEGGDVEAITQRPVFEAACVAKGQETLVQPAVDGSATVLPSSDKRARSVELEKGEGSSKRPRRPAEESSADPKEGYVEKSASPGHEIRRVNTQTFACARGVSDEDFEIAFPVNAAIARYLGLLVARAEVGARIGRSVDSFRVRGFRAAAAALRRLPFDTTCVEDVRLLVSDPDVSAIGSKIGARMEEILCTGRLREVDDASKSGHFRSLEELCGVWGIGPVRAAELVGDGVCDVRELRLRVSTNPLILDRQQRIGLECYEDLMERIPRSEVAAINHYVRECVRYVSNGENVTVTVAGSYLRGKASCGDIDVVLASCGRVDLLLRRVVDKMAEDGKLTHSLLFGRHKFFGIVRLETGMRRRRIDLFGVPMEQHAFALLTYTGSGKFNRSMRCLAGKLGFRLSHKGITRVRRTSKGAVPVGAPIACETEEDIFRLLGLEYRSPENRDV